jgi:glutamine synthetase
MFINRFGKNLFRGEESCGLSQMALYYVGGIIKHGKALNAFCNPTTNSYKRLVPGFEAPVILAYSECNRSASIRIPKITTPNAKRIEVRFPDPACNPFLAMAAMLMAGLDGIKNKIDPGKAAVDNLYNLPGQHPTVAHNLEDALNALDASREIFKNGDVFTDELLDSFIDYKRNESRNIQMIPTPIEFEKYYSC